MAFVAMVPAFAQAHAGHGATGTIESGHARHVGHTLSVAAHVGAVAADAASDRADCVGCPSCCCAHVFVAASETDAGRADRLGGRRVAMGPDGTHPSAVAEALPEPPRPFA